MNIDDIKSRIDEAIGDEMPDGAFTMKELRRQSGRSRDWCSDLINSAIELGLCEFIDRLPVRNRIGTINQVPHYRFIDSKKKGKKK